MYPVGGGRSHDAAIALAADRRGLLVAAAGWVRTAEARGRSTSAEKTDSRYLYRCVVLPDFVLSVPFYCLRRDRQVNRVSCAFIKANKRRRERRPAEGEESGGRVREHRAC
jgi:hypothetical protein